MLTLTTFGGLALGSAGKVLGGAAGQRRPLAVLAILAVAGDAGASRERLVGILWPDADPERARRTLTQTIYSLRRATGVENLVLGSTDLRLNRAAVACDVLAFEDALRDGRLADAVGAYRAPFLDGVSLPGAVDFERWAESERERLARRCGGALATLAGQAEGAGDLHAAVDWRRRLVALDPLDAPTTLALVDLLARAGDTVGALRAARIHETLLRDQLDLPIAPALAARVERLRTQRTERAATPPIPTAATIPAEPEAVTDAVTGAAPTPSAAPMAVSTVRRASLPRRLVRVLGVAGAAVGLVAAGVAIGRGTRAAPLPPPPATGRGIVAVVPFATDAADRALAYLGEGTADAIARMLTSPAGPRAIDPGTVLAAAARVGRGRAASGGAWARERDVGRAVGASEVLVGRITGRPARLTIDAALVDVATGSARATAVVAGPADSLAGLLAALTARVVVGRELEGERASAFGSVGLPALRAYLEAEAAARDDRTQEAVRLYEQALDRDSTFAPAALGLAEAADRYNGAEQHDRGLALAWAERARLSERDRAYLVALAGPRYPEPSPAPEQLAAWERAVTLAPDRASAWSEFGERLLQDGAVLGLRAPEQRASAAFRRALDLDPDHAPALRQLVELAALRGDTATLRATASPEQLRRYGRDLTGYLTWRAATVRGDSAALARVRDRISSLGVPSLRAIAMAAQHTGLGRADGERALRVLAARAALGTEQFDVLLAQHSLALNAGQPVRALDVTELLQDAQPGTRAHLRLRVLDALYASGDSATAAAAARELSTTADAPTARAAGPRAIQLADACVLAQWRVARVRGPGPEAAQVRSTIAALRAGAMPRTLVPVEVTPPACADLLQAMLAVALREPEARRRVERLDAVVLTGPAIGDARTYAGLVVARLYDRLGDPQRALVAIRQRAYLKGWPRYLATSLREESSLALAAGDTAGAITAARRYLALRHEPEAPLRAEVDAMRARVARLGGANAGR